MYTEITFEDNSKSIQKNNEDGSILFIPIDLANTEYQQYLAWLENPEAAQLTLTIPGSN